MNSNIWENWSIAFILLNNGNPLYSKQLWTHENIAQGFYLSTFYTILRQLKIEIAHAKFVDFIWS